jgi:hypothetical protein
VIPAVLSSERNPSLLLQEEGYIVIRSFLSDSLIKRLETLIQTRLHQCAADLSCTYQEYLQVASRWVSPSPITEGMEEIAVNFLKPFLEDLMEEEIELVKLNVISKTPYSPEILPFHQDIAYSPTTAYQFSAWLALTNVPLESGPMEVMVGSHKGPIKHAVDFWLPEFKDNISLKNHFKKKLPVSAGDLIIFDSCLWHGSGKNESAYERFALVTRWKTKNYRPPYIPPIQPHSFGMWTCRKETEKVLRKGLEVIFQNCTAPTTYNEILQSWGNYLKTTPLSFLKDPKKAQESLSLVFLLNKAHAAHNGGDAQGILYKRLWEDLLEPLSAYMNAREI